MSHDTDRIVEDLKKLVAELETLAAHAGEGTGEQIGAYLDDAAAHLRGVLDAAQRRIGDLQTEVERRVRRTAKTVNESVRENTWTTLALAAATALLLGAALARGSKGSTRASD